MNKCLRITIRTKLNDEYMQKIVLKKARELGLEGTAQIITPQKEARIVVCGNKDQVDNFLDVLHKGSDGVIPEEILIEPFLKEKDYRGVFRVIE